MFEDPSYRSCNFLHLECLNGDTLKPTYINGGVWLSPMGGNLSVAMRMFRCILNHAPIGSYYKRSNILNLLLAIAAFIAKIVIMSSFHATSIKGKPIGILII